MCVGCQNSLCIVLRGVCRVLNILCIVLRGVCVGCQNPLCT